MKVLAAAVMAAAATMILAGAALAGEGTKAPAPGTWEYQLALETGTLPAASSAKLQQQSAQAGPQVPTIEVGGQVYRVGIDTN